MNESLDSTPTTTIDFQQQQKSTNETTQKEELAVASLKEPIIPETVASQQQRIANYYETAAFELLSICNTLYTKASTIYKQWAEGGNEGSEIYDLETLWHKCWCPLLQAMAR